MLCQNDPGFKPISDFAKYACMFLDMAFSKEYFDPEFKWTESKLVAAWEGARSRDIISGDLNGDGDFDDPGEDIILSPASLCRYLELPISPIDISSLGAPLVEDENHIMRVAPSNNPYDRSLYWVIERWYLKGSHFVVGDGSGKNPPIFDSIRGGSQTRAKGKLMDLRVFRVVA